MPLSVPKLLYRFIAAVKNVRDGARETEAAPNKSSIMKKSIFFLASLAAASAFAPTLPSYTRATAKRAGPVCSAVGGSRILQPFEQRRALKVQPVAS